MKTVNLDDFALSGGGFLGESYTCPGDPSVMLKLYRDGFSQMAVSEYEMSSKVKAEGIPVPKVLELVRTPEGRCGMLFARLEGKKSLARMIGDEPWTAEERGEVFASICKDLHSRHLDKSKFHSVKNSYAEAVERNEFLETIQKDKLVRFISDVPESDTALHGDLHYGNVVFSAGRHYFIDLGEFGYGSPLFDLGMVYMSCRLMPGDLIKNLFHITAEVAARFWKSFLGTYFGNGYCVGGKVCDDIEERLKVFAGLRGIVFENNTRSMHPEFRTALQSILG